MRVPDVGPSRVLPAAFLLLLGLTLASTEMAVPLGWSRGDAVQALTAILTLVAIAVALWGDRLRSWFHPPALILDPRCRLPDCDVSRHPVLLGGLEVPNRFRPQANLRVRVWNVGSGAAHRIEVLLDRILVLDALTFRAVSEVDWLLPMMIKCLHTREVEEVIRDVLPPGAQAHFDLGAGVPVPDSGRGTTTVILKTEVDQPGFTNQLSEGTYALRLRIFCAEAESPFEHWIRLRVGSKWPVGEDAVIGNHIHFEGIETPQGADSFPDGPTQSPSH